jgi:hypothetical protein
MQYPSLSNALSCVRRYVYKAASSLTAGVLAAGLLLSTSLAQAATVITDPTNDANAIGIADLRLGNFLFDVEFVVGSAEMTYGSLPNFESDPEGFFNRAVELTALVNDVLNTAPEVKSVGPEGQPVGSFLYGFAKDRGTANYFAFATVGQYSEGEGWILGEGDYNPPPAGGPGFVLTSYELSFETWARYDFKDVVVPIPAAVWLFASGLLGLIGVARQKHQA